MAKIIIGHVVCHEAISRYR